MDFTSKPAIELTALALDGLAARHKILSANIANAETPGYKRTDVTFNDQLSKLMVDQQTKQKAKEDYSMSLMYYPNSLSSSGQINTPGNNVISENYETDYKSFNPEIIQTNEADTKPNGNNISIEHEMAELTQNGMKYNALATLQEKMFRGLQDIIKGAM